MAEKRISDVPLVPLRHSYYKSLLSGNAKRIKEAIDQSLIPMTPLEISQKTGISHNTVKKCVLRLAKKGFVQHLCYGLYVNPAYGVTLGAVGVGGGDRFLLRAHGLQITIPRFKVAGPRHLEKAFGRAKITILRYRKSAQVSVRCEKPYSLDGPAFEAVVSWAMENLGIKESAYGRLKANVELNNDIFGLRINHGKAITLKDVMGTFRRVYNTQYGCRDEIKIREKRPLDEIIAALYGGFHISQVMSYLRLDLEARQQERKENADLHKSLMLLIDAALKPRGAFRVLRKAIATSSESAPRHPFDNSSSIQKESIHRQNLAQSHSFVDRWIWRLTPLDVPEKGFCTRCLQRTILRYYVEDRHGYSGLVCKDCGQLLKVLIDGRR